MPINYDEPIEIRDTRNGSWFWIHTHIMDDIHIGKSDFSVYCSLSTFANSQQELFPSIKKISIRAKCSKRQTYKSVKLLEKLEYLSIKRRKGHSNLYTLLKTIPKIVDKGGDIVSRVQPLHPPGAINDPTTSATIAPITRSNRTISINNKRKLKKIKEKNPINILQ